MTFPLNKHTNVWGWGGGSGETVRQDFSLFTLAPVLNEDADCYSLFRTSLNHQQTERGIVHLKNAKDAARVFERRVRVQHLHLY